VDWSRRRRRRSNSSQCGTRQQHSSCDHSMYHTPALLERERERSPRTAAAVHCTPSKPPKVFHLHHQIMKASFETKFPVFCKHSDQVFCILQISRSRLFFSCKKAPEQGFLFSANF
jgi:hypothetical protein